MTNSKMTKKEKFTKLLSVVELADIMENDRELLVDFINHEINLLNNKTVSKKATKTQEKMAELMEKIKDTLSVLTGEKMTVSEILKKDKWFYENDISSQAATSALKKLCESDSGIYNEKDKKKSLYFYKEEEETFNDEDLAE